MLRKATKSDSELIWKWRNDELTRKMFFNSDYIAWGDHVKWLDVSLKSSYRRLYIYEELKVPLAFIRLDIEEKGTDISVNVAPEHRGKGIGKKALQETIKKAKELNLYKLTAKIKPENTPSIYIFFEVGFKRIKNYENYTLMEYDIK